MRYYHNKASIRAVQAIAILILFVLTSTFAAAEGTSENTDTDGGVSSSSFSTATTWLVNGYHNCSETYAEMQLIADSYPSIAKFYDLSVMFPLPSTSPQVTWEGRHIYALKISDNPQVNESDEPEVLYMGLHHAREWITVEVCLSIMQTLTSQYLSDATIKGYVDNNEIWIVPIVNPDGLEYSQYTQTMWRKNRRDNGGSFGVDLNRNYGFKWGYNNIGSSPSPTSNTYRGPAPFSEPETRIVRDLMESRDFVSSISFHSHGEVILFPWGYIAADTPHHSLYQKLSQEMVQYNGFDFGNYKSGAIYQLNGEYTDWAYGNLTNIAFCFELGTQFIPPSSQIPSINSANTNAAFVLLKYAHNPWEVFNSGIHGYVFNSTGFPIPGATVSTEILGEKYTKTTDSMGQYLLHFPPGSFNLKATKYGYTSDTKSAVPVSPNTYTRMDLIIDDIFTPAVKSVTSHVDDGGDIDSDGIYDVGRIVNITVVEWNDEANLVGTIEIASLGSRYHLPPQPLDMNLVSSDNATYYYHWDTTGIEPGDDFALEARLGDHAANWDMDGSNNLGPDHIISLVDRIPPEIIDVDSRLEQGPVISTENVYEIGSMVKITVSERYNETGLTGNVTISSASKGYDSGRLDLMFEPEEDTYATLWDTSGLSPCIDYGVEATLSDASDNADADGLPSSPDLSIALQDTISPEVEGVDSKVGDDHDERYEIESIVTLIVSEAMGESGLEGSIEISSSEPDYNSGPIPLQEVFTDFPPGTYQAFWNTSGLVPFETYQVEVRLSDQYGNADDDGSDPEGCDLIIALEDSHHPEIEIFDSFVRSDGDERYEGGSKVTLVVTPRSWEGDLTCKIEIAARNHNYTSGIIELEMREGVKDLVGMRAGDEAIPSKNHFFALWDTIDLSLDEYIARAVIYDRNGNPSLSVDLSIVLEDTTPPPCVEDLKWTQDEDGSPDIYLEWRNPDPDAIILVYMDYIPFEGDEVNYSDHLALISPTVLMPNTDTLEDSILFNVTLHYLILTEDAFGNRNTTINSGNSVSVIIVPLAIDNPNEDDLMNETEGGGEKPDPQDEETGGEGSPLSSSGDSSLLYLFIVLFVCLLVVIVGLFLYKRATKRDDEEDVEDGSEDEDGPPKPLEAEIVEPSEVIKQGSPSMMIGGAIPASMGQGQPALPPMASQIDNGETQNTVGTLPAPPAAKEIGPGQNALQTDGANLLPKH